MKRAALLLLTVGLLAAGSILSGCATVRPYEKERLADPIMSFREETREATRELHWIEAREGSNGGTGVSGGGCACN
ncbi:MAG: hypothetical protein DHS20C21_04370 [Gemmatimonadota bacterium]|nr:MAG: hypothetical protein DHS20C21_04370 [Gemmatimonadota bacterium]